MTGTRHMLAAIDRHFTRGGIRPYSARAGRDGRDGPDGALPDATRGQMTEFRPHVLGAPVAGGLPPWMCAVSKRIAMLLLVFVSVC